MSLLAPSTLHLPNIIKRTMTLRNTSIIVIAEPTVDDSERLDGTVTISMLRKIAHNDASCIGRWDHFINFM